MKELEDIIIEMLSQTPFPLDETEPYRITFKDSEFIIVGMFKYVDTDFPMDNLHGRIKSTDIITLFEVATYISMKRYLKKK